MEKKQSAFKSILNKDGTKSIISSLVSILAGMLVGKEIEVWRDDEEDVLLSEFSNEIDEWVIERLESIGCDTAKSVLAFTPEDIAKRADLEDETVAEVFRILKAEFED